jgi:hypothetical protein
MPEFTADQPLVGIEPALYGLLDAFMLPDDACEQLAAALELLQELQSQLQEAAAGAAPAAAAQQRLSRFAGDYAQLRMWAGRGRGGQVEKALQRMLENVLKG